MCMSGKSRLETIPGRQTVVDPKALIPALIPALFGKQINPSDPQFSYL